MQDDQRDSAQRAAAGAGLLGVLLDVESSSVGGSCSLRVCLRESPALSTAVEAQEEVRTPPCHTFLPLQYFRPEPCLCGDVLLVRRACRTAQAPHQAPERRWLLQPPGVHTGVSGARHQKRWRRRRRRRTAGPTRRACDASGGATAGGATSSESSSASPRRARAGRTVIILATLALAAPMPSPPVPSPPAQSPPAQSPPSPALAARVVAAARRVASAVVGAAIAIAAAAATGALSDVALAAVAAAAVAALAAVAVAAAACPSRHRPSCRPRRGRLEPRGLAGSGAVTVLWLVQVV